jgi:hypothetical protein
MRRSIDDMMPDAEVVVATNTSSAFREIDCGIREDQILIDLAETVRSAFIRTSQSLTCL